MTSQSYLQTEASSRRIAPLYRGVGSAVWQIGTLIQEISISRKDIPASDQGIPALGQEIEASGQEIEASGQEIEASGQGIEAHCREIATSGRGIVMHCRGMTTSDRGIAASGREMTTFAQGIEASGEEMGASGQGNDASAQEIVTFGKGINAILKRQTLTNCGLRIFPPTPPVTTTNNNQPKTTMKDLWTNRLDMIGAVIAVADAAAHYPVWTGEQPADFETDYTAMKADYESVVTLAATAYAATTGTADEKAEAERQLEDLAYAIARACYVHFTKTGDLVRRAQVAFTKTSIVHLRGQTLLTTCTSIRDIATACLAEPNAANRGITAPRITALNSAIGTFSGFLNAPRAAIATRATLIREVETRIAGLVTQVELLDDLVVQFDATPEGRALIAAWKQARIIMDLGHGPETPPAPPTPPTP